MRKVWQICAVVLVLVMVFGVWLWRDYQAFLNTPLVLPDPGRVFVVRPGTTPTSLIRNWAEQGMTEDSWSWRLLTRLEPVNIRAGEFLLTPGMLPREALQKLATDQVVQYSITLLEGWTYQQLISALTDDQRLVQVDRKELSSERVMSLIGSEADHPEGWFLPETYAFVRGDSVIDVLRRAHLAMVEALSQAWEARDDALPLKEPYELLILASIVEKEAGVAAERPQVAGVFTRRLEQGWRLETDPTVIYGLGDAFDGNLRRADLRADTPYNTYLNFGLPPTPIAMPGPQSLKASASPAEGTAMFFVADGEGGHVFSDNLADHNRAVRALVRKQTGRH